MLIDEPVNNVRLLINVLLKTGAIERLDDNSLYLLSLQNLIGSEGSSTDRVRRFRERQKALQCNNNQLQIEGEIMSNSEIDVENLEKLQCNDNVTTDKNKGALTSASGIPNLETAVPLLLTEVNRKNLDLRLIPKILSENAAKTFGLKNKGRIAIGKDADLTMINLKKEGKFDIDTFKTKAEYSPFENWEYKGKPVMTIVNGKIIMDNL